MKKKKTKNIKKEQELIIKELILKNLIMEILKISTSLKEKIIMVKIEDIMIIIMIKLLVI